MPSRPRWNALPTEVCLAVIALLDHDTLCALSQASRSDHALCLPSIFRNVAMPSFSALQAFLNHVPPAYGTHIRGLDICTQFPPPSPCSILPSSPATPRSDAVIRLLARAPHLERLTLHLSGGLAPHALAAFPGLTRLSDLEVENCDDEDVAPLSERTVVAIALSLPQLRRLSLTRITRSFRTASSPISGSFPFVENAAKDQLPHTLPTLLTIPTLRHLAIHDTHLGDPRFCPMLLPATAPLTTLELGAYEGISPAENARYAARVVACVGPSLTSAVLGSALPPSTHFAFPALKSLRMTPLMPPCGIPDTLCAISAPLENVEVECLAEDLEDVCEVLGDCDTDAWTIRLRVLRGLDDDVLAVAVAVDEDIVLDGETREMLRRLERAGKRIVVEGAVFEDEDGGEDGEEVDWDGKTVVGDASPVPEKRATMAHELPQLWVRAQAW